MSGVPILADQHPAGVKHREDRKSTRLNSSHSQISYAVFCLKKKKKTHTQHLVRRVGPIRASAPPDLSRRFQLLVHASTQPCSLTFTHPLGECGGRSHQVCLT